ncbi:MAG: DUF4154 domain-containing protein [Bacteroidales bacterium]|nr:DUF4154 domain-containing protein [Bacteroidales bacterium]
MTTLCIGARAQYGDTPDDQKAKFLYEIPKYLLWENDENITTIYIGVVNGDPDLFKRLRKEARKPYSGAGTKVVVNDYVTVQDAAADTLLNLLYIPYSPEVSMGIEAFKGRPVAIVSDNYIDHRQIMIDFVDEKSGVVSFRYSSANLRNVGISVHENITRELHGDDISKNEILNDKDSLLASFKNALTQKEKELARKQKLLDEKEREIFEKELTIDKQNRSIARQSQAITDQMDRLAAQKESVKRMQQQQEKQQKELDKAAEQLVIKNKEINFVETELERQKKHLDEQRQIADEQKKTLDLVNGQIAAKQKELEQLDQNNQLLNNRLLRAWVAIVAFLILLAVIVKFYIDKRRDNQKLADQNNALLLAHEEISKQKEEIASQNEKIIESIVYAQNIQRAVMPTMEYFDQYLPEHFILLKPRDIVSGDFYWGTHIGDKFVYTAADCTGHGVPGAFMSLLGISFLNEIAGRSNARTVSAADILNALRKKIITYLHQTGKEGEQQDGMDMALCIYDKEGAKLQYAGAFNPLVIIRDGTLTQYDADEMPIGYYENQTARFTNHVIDVKKGDMAYMFSDGYADQFGMVEGRKKKYLIKRFKEFLLEIHTLGMKEQEQRLDDNLTQWRGDLKQLDDVLVLGTRF